MFERFTEKARRVIFFARYEASMYGSPYIETEHLLLGLFREDPSVVVQFLPKPYSLEEIHAEILKTVDVRERIATSIEIPLTFQCKKALNLAAEEAQSLNHRHVGTEHLFLALLQIPDSLAATILARDGRIDPSKVRNQLRTFVPSPVPNANARLVVRPGSAPQPSGEQELHAFDTFLAALRAGDATQIEDLLAEHAEFIDASGKLWAGQSTILDNRHKLLAPFATRRARPHLEIYSCTPGGFWAGIILWRDVTLPGFSPLDLYRMSVIFGYERSCWQVFLIQVTSLGAELAAAHASA